VSAKFYFLLLILIFPLYSQTLIEVGRFGGQGSGNGLFNNPLAISISKENIVYVVDTGNNRIQLFDLHGKFLKSVGGFGFANDQFDAPYDIWTNSLINIYVSDYNNRRVQRYDRNMNFINSLTSNEGADSDFQFSEIASCAVNSQNDLFIVDHEEYKIIKFNRNGAAERVFGRLDTGQLELQFPEQIDLWGTDKLVVSDPAAKALYIFDFFGSLVFKITHDDFKQPRGIDADFAKNIYVADPESKSLFFISADLKNISKINFISKLSAPRDVAVVTNEKEKFLYVIDGNEVIIGTLRSE